MNINDDFPKAQLTAYLSLREALGFQQCAEKTLLPEFVAYIQAHNIAGLVHAHLALDWACAASTQRGSSGATIPNRDTNSDELITELYLPIRL